MSANLEAKKQVVEEIKAKIEASKSVVFADYNNSRCWKRLRSETSSERRTANTRCIRTPLSERLSTNSASPISTRISTARRQPSSARRDERRCCLFQAVKENPALTDKIVPNARTSTKRMWIRTRQRTCGHSFQGSAHCEVARLPAVVHFQVRLCARFYCKGKRSGKQLMYF